MAKKGFGSGSAFASAEPKVKANTRRARTSPTTAASVVGCGANANRRGEATLGFFIGSAPNLHHAAGACPVIFGFVLHLETWDRA